MAKPTQGGAMYSTDDLIRMATLGQFGNMSMMVARAMTRLKELELENAQLYERVQELENIQTVADPGSLDDTEGHTYSSDDLPELPRY